MISFSSSANRYIKYAYNASGILIRKQQYDNIGGVATLQTTTDYIDGFVFTTAGAGTAALQYFAMPEGRVLNNASTLSQEFTMADQQGNVRIAFDNTGTGGVAKTRQENSYYAFGMIMPGSVVVTPGNQNRNLYNGGSEWQNDYGNLPDYYQTFYRNYDATLGRWIGVDPKGGSAESMTGYQCGVNNPVMMNDPMGDLFETYGIAKQHTGNEIARIENWEEEQQMGAGAAYAGGGSYLVYLATTGQSGGQTVYQAGDDYNDPSGLSTGQLNGLIGTGGRIAVNNYGVAFYTQTIEMRQNASPVDKSYNSSVEYVMVEHKDFYSFDNVANQGGSTCKRSAGHSQRSIFTN
jgi:RHS repeat-associated protein